MPRGPERSLRPALLAEASDKLGEMATDCVAARCVDHQRMVGRMQHSDRRRTSVHPRFASPHKLADELRAAAKHRERYAKALRQRAANNDGGGADIVQAQGPTAAAAIRIELAGARPQIPIACVSSKTTYPPSRMTQRRYFGRGATRPQSGQNPSARMTGRKPLALSCSIMRCAETGS